MLLVADLFLDQANRSQLLVFPYDSSDQPEPCICMSCENPQLDVQTLRYAGNGYHLLPSLLHVPLLQTIPPICEFNSHLRFNFV